MMKKVLKAMMIGIAALILLVIGIGKYFGSRQRVSADYENDVKTGGKIEKTYLAEGEYEVSIYEELALQGFSKYTICYPKQMEQGLESYPVIVFCNGTGVPFSKYISVAKHFASWGFLVIGTEEEYDWNGFSAEMCVRHLQKLNQEEIINEKENIFYGKIDLERIGIVGHSQGAVGVLSAITGEQKEMFRAAVCLSPTNKELAHNIEWDYDATIVDTPILLISGAGGGDDWVVTGEQLKEIYNDISGNKVMARRKDTPHGEMLYSANGYVMAWFLSLLQNDENAKKAFFTDSPELLQNEWYENQKMDIAN